MVPSIRLLLMILAIVCFFLAAIGVRPMRGDLIAGGLCLWAAAVVLAG